jgi:hypothetical protein
LREAATISGPMPSPGSTRIFIYVSMRKGGTAPPVDPGV